MTFRSYSIQYPLSNRFLDNVLLSYITLINAKTWAYELNSNFKNKSEWTLSFYEFRSEKQAQALAVTFSRRKQNNLRNAQMHIRSENLFY